MPSTRGTNAPRRSKRVTEAEKQQAKVKAQQAAKATAAAAAAAKKKAAAAAKKLKAEDKAESVVADVKKKAGKAVKEVKKQVVKPAAKKVAKAAGVDTKPTKATATKSKKADDKATTKAKKPAATQGKKTKSSTSKAVSASKPAAAPKKRAPPKARGTAAAAASTKKADKPKKEESAAVTPYKVGDIVEDVTLQNEDDKPVSLKSLYEDKHLVIFSYPKADTPGCTTQACGYRDIRNEYEEHGATVIGLSCDQPTAQIKWKSKNELGYSLLSDPKADLLLKKLGWSDKSKRCHWVIEKGGKLAEAKLGVKPADDPKNALEFVKSLKDSK